MACIALMRSMFKSFCAFIFMLYVRRICGLGFFVYFQHGRVRFFPFLFYVGYVGAKVVCLVVLCDICWSEICAFSCAM